MRIIAAAFIASLVLPSAAPAASVFDFNSFARGEQTRWMSDGGTSATVGYAARRGVPVACDTGATTSSCDESGALQSLGMFGAARNAATHAPGPRRMTIPAASGSTGVGTTPFQFSRFSQSATGASSEPVSGSGPRRFTVRGGGFGTARGQEPLPVLLNEPVVSLNGNPYTDDGEGPEVQVVPLPAGMPLLLGALGGLALVRKRRTSKV